MGNEAIGRSLPRRDKLHPRYVAVLPNAHQASYYEHFRRDRPRHDQPELERNPGLDLEQPHHGHRPVHPGIQLRLHRKPTPSRGAVEPAELRGSRNLDLEKGTEPPISLFFFRAYTFLFFQSSALLPITFP